MSCWVEASSAFKLFLYKVSPVYNQRRGRGHCEREIICTFFDVYIEGASVVYLLYKVSQKTPLLQQGDEWREPLTSPEVPALQGGDGLIYCP